jgi:hypothetical protein
LQSVRESEAPEPVSSYYASGNANEPVFLYRGDLLVTTAEDSSPARFPGHLALHWLPTPRVRYELIAKRQRMLHWFANDIQDSNVAAPTFTAVPVPPSGQQLAASGDSAIFGGIFCPDLIGDSGAELSQVLFHVVNFRRIMGDPLKKDGHWWRGRLSCRTTTWSIILDSLPEYGKLERELKEKGGYAVTHNGKFRRNDGKSFSIADAQDLIGMLRMILSFSSGRWVTPMLPVGFDNENVPAWSDWNVYRLDGWRGAYQPLDPGHPEQFIEFFDLASKAWKDPFSRRVIGSAVNYFIDGNRPLPLELATSTFQAGLELLAWTELVEERGILTATSYKKRPAHENICDFLTAHKVNTSVPTNMASLQAVAQSENCKSGPEVITRMRNGVIHPKRNRPEFGIDAWYDAWSLAQQYIVLGLLALLNYSGSYRDPLNENIHIGAITKVPWAP